MAKFKAIINKWVRRRKAWTTRWCLDEAQAVTREMLPPGEVIERRDAELACERSFIEGLKLGMKN